MQCVFTFVFFYTNVSQLDKVCKHNHYKTLKTSILQCLSFPNTTPGALFRKSRLLDRDFLNNAPGLDTENSGIGIAILHC